MMFPLPSFRPRSAFLAWAGCLLVSLSCVASVHAQDRLVLTDNTEQLGKVASVSGGAVAINLPAAAGGGQTAIPLARVARAEVAAPAAYQAGLAAYRAGNWDKALADLKPLADQFRGLPVEWTQGAASLLGDIYIEKKDPAKAEAAYNDFRLTYPRSASPVRLGVAQARIAYAKNDAAKAKQMLQGLAQLALKNPALVTAIDGASYGQAFYLLGQIQEKDGSFQDALESYLRTITLFYQDAGATARAQQSVDALRLSHKDITAP